MRVVYNGPLDAVEVADLHQVVVKQGESIEVSDELGARLVEQACWDEVAAAPAEQAAKPAAKSAQKKES